MATRILARHALEQDTRRRIHAAIAEDPGARVGTLSRRLGLSYVTVERHVRVLRELGLVDAVEDRQRRLFVRGAAPHGALPREAVLAAGPPTVRAILGFLVEHAPVDVPTLRARLGLPKSTASAALRRLERARLVTTRRRCRRLVVEVVDGAQARRIVAARPPGRGAPAGSAGAMGENRGPTCPSCGRAPPAGVGVPASAEAQDGLDVADRVDVAGEQVHALGAEQDRHVGHAQHGPPHAPGGS